MRMESDRRERTRRLIEAARAVPIEGLLERAGVTHRRGRGWPCPVCGIARADNGCGIVRSSPGRWHCFQCGQGGTALDLWLLWSGHNPERLDRAALEAVEGMVGDVVPSISSVAIPAEDVRLLTPAQVSAYWGQYARRWPLTVPWLESRGLSALGAELGACDDAGLIPAARGDLRVAVRDGGSVIMMPLRSTIPEMCGRVSNVVVRGGPVKALCLNRGAGTTRDGGLWPMVYGHPERVAASETVIVVEGGPDWLTALHTWGGPGVEVVGSFCADDLSTVWSQWLRGVPGRLVFVPHLDGVQWRCLACRGGWRKLARFALREGGLCPDCGGEVERRRAGIAAMRACMEQVGRGEWFPWRRVLDGLGIGLGAFLARGSTDLNDLVRPDVWGVEVGRLTKTWCLPGR